MKRQKDIFLWLITGCVMIFIMVIIGGITRLTDSGLSIVEWKVIGGIIPPLNESEWNVKFEDYKKYPEYKKKYPEHKSEKEGMKLEEFKTIFFWEYLHRFWGRLIGIVFIIPFLIFYFKKKLEGKILNQCIIIFILGGLQGLLGWLMVKSGLIDIPQVSHYRLAAHLILAFFLYSYILWVALGIIIPKINSSVKSEKVNLICKILIFFLTIQIIYGAFMSGLEAGFRFPTFPLMDGKFIPSDIFDKELPFYLNFFENSSMIQTIHRYLALFISILTIYFYIKLKSFKNIFLFRISSNLLIIILATQLLLGALTVLGFKQEVREMPITLASLHQIFALLLLTNFVFILKLIHKTSFQKH